LKIINKDPATDNESIPAGKTWYLFKSMAYARYAITGRIITRATIIIDFLIVFPPYPTGYNI